MQAVKAGKHVFCEKSITVNSRQLEECVAIAKEKGLVICDGMTLLHMPLYKKLKEMISEGAIGDVKMVQVNFGSCKEYDVTNHFFSKELAGEKGFIEIYDYPRAAKATITYTETGKTEVIEEGDSTKVLQYEVADMQNYVWNNGGEENLAIVRDVMETLTSIRNQWGMVYPFE